MRFFSRVDNDMEQVNSLIGLGSNTYIFLSFSGGDCDCTVQTICKGLKFVHFQNEVVMMVQIRARLQPYIVDDQSKL